MKRLATAIVRHPLFEPLVIALILVNAVILAMETSPGIMDRMGPTLIALVHAYRNDFDTAFEWLDRAYEERDDYLIEIRMYKGFESLYADPRWEDLLTRIGISDANAEAIGL